MDRTLLFRKVVLLIAGNPLIRRFVTGYGMRLGAARFVAGETLEECISKVKRMNAQGFAATLDYLGESVFSRQHAEEAADMIMQTLDAISEHDLDAHISVKLTQLGLLFDEEECLGYMSRIVERARDCGTFVRIDMEDSAVTERTLHLYHRLEERYGNRHAGVAIQSYLYRSRHDLSKLSSRHVNVRIVKGAYHEPREVAFPDKQEVDNQFLSLAKIHMLSGSYTAIATHDPGMIAPLKQFALDHGIPSERFEFQMLYGIAEGLQRQLLQEGYKVRIYTPYGKRWYSYFSRRIAERPANLSFVWKGIMRGRKSS